MFFHKDCGGAVFLNNNTLRILSEFTITQKGVRPTLSEIVKIDNEKLEVSFLCTVCNKVVPPENIMAHCFNCGKPYPLNKVFKVVKHSGVYCLDCCNDFIGSTLSKKPVLDLLKFYLGKEDPND